jgi:hypothetical protein
LDCRTSAHNGKRISGACNSDLVIASSSEYDDRVRLAVGSIGIRDTFQIEGDLLNIGAGKAGHYR